AGEQHDLSDGAAGNVHPELALAQLREVAGDRRYDGIGHEVAARGPEQLRNSARSGGIEYRQPRGTFSEVECERREAKPRSERKADEQHAKILQGERYRSE